MSEKLSEVEKSDETILYKNASIKFTLHDDPLYPLEETRGWEIEQKARKVLQVREAGKKNQSKAEPYLNNPQYTIDLDFSNVKSLTYFVEAKKSGKATGTPRTSSISESEEMISLTCMIETYSPCPSSKREVSSDTNPEKPWTYEFTRSRSPFNMGPEELYLNNWNLNQTFIFKGQSTYLMLDKFIEVVKKQSPSSKVLHKKID